MNPAFDGTEESFTQDDADLQGAISIPPADRPCFKVFSNWTEVTECDAKLPPGVWHFSMRAPRAKTDAPEPTQKLVCSPLFVEAVTCDRTDSNYGRLLRFKTTKGVWREWAMPMDITSGHAEELHKILLNMGVVIQPTSKSLLQEYLVHRTPTRELTCSTQVGWHDACFVLPDKVIGADCENLIYQSTEPGINEYGTKGTTESWRSGIGKAAIGNPLVILAISAAFAGPLLAKVNAEGGGLHFVGDSSTGKTTLLDIASSVWGSPHFKKSWRSTANGMEGAAALFNDCLFAIDEISQCDPREVGSIVYALGNGIGKQRASRAGLARPVTRWRCMVLSNGERTIATSMMEAGKLIKAGQGVRLLDIPANRRYGAFDTLSMGKTNGAQLSDSFKKYCAGHYGCVGRDYLEQLTQDKTSHAIALQTIKDLPEFKAADAEEDNGQDKRAAHRMALIACAGELATSYKLTGWPVGAATQAAAIALAEWRQARATGNTERNQVLEALSEFLEKHGDSRFSDAGANSLTEDKRTPVRDRAGWWKDDGTLGTVFLFTASGIKEALKGHDFRRAIKTLLDLKVILPGPKQAARTVRVGGLPMSIYMVSPDNLQKVI